MAWKAGESGNRKGRGKGTANKVTSQIRALINDNSADILRQVIAQAKAGDPQAQAAFLKLLPKYRVVMTPVDLPLAQSACEAQEQIARLTCMAARGDLDLDALQVLSRTLTLAIDTRLTQLEERLEERERDAVDAA